MNKIILHLCAKEGSDTLPYKQAGYDVRIIGEEIGVENYYPPEDVYGIIANPVCSEFSRLKIYNPDVLRDLKKGMFLVKECLRIIWECQYRIKNNAQSSPLKFWSIENPATGILNWFLGNPTFVYQPYEYGANYSKKTALWGMFNIPIRPLLYNQIESGKHILNLKSKNSEETMQLRSKAFYPFAQAFFDANP